MCMRRIFLAFAVIVAAVPMCLLAAAEWVAAEHHLEPGDHAVAAIIFFTPDDQKRHSYERIAADLFFEGKVEQIVCVGGARPHRNYFGSHEVGVSLQAMGVPAASLQCGDRASDDSRSNLVRANEVLGPADLRRSVLVADRLHGMRLMAQARMALGQTPRWMAAPDYLSAVDGVIRSYWELAAWVSLALPASWYRALVNASRS